MLILTRKPGESLYIGDDIKVTIVEIKGHQIRVGIDAPTSLKIFREEIYLQILEENKQAADSGSNAESTLDELSVAWNESKGGDEGEGKQVRKIGVTLGSFGSTKVAGSLDPKVVVKKKRRSEDK